MRPSGADPNSAALGHALQDGLAELGLSLPAAAQTDLLAYLKLLVKWNRIYNLTSVRDPMQMLRRHLLDCLAVVPALQREAIRGRLLDVGSGGGLPGVVWAICCPKLEVTCVDAVQKKAAFVRQVGGTLGLANLQSLHARVEQLDGAYDTIASRAFASLADFVAGSRHLLAPDGIWLAMKGHKPVEEIAALPADVQMFHVEQLAPPGLEGAARCLVWLRAVG